MSDEPSTPAAKESEVNPDDLIAHIRNNSIVKGVVLSIVVHIVVIAATSLPALAAMAGMSTGEEVVDGPTTDTSEATTTKTDKGHADAILADKPKTGDGTSGTTGEPGTGGIDNERLDKLLNDTEEPVTEPTLNPDLDTLD